MNFLGWTNIHVSRLTGQLIVYYTESWRRIYYQGNMHWIEVLYTLAFHSQWVRLGARNMYYDVIALAAAAQCRETRQGDTTSGGRHDVLFSLHVTALDQSYFCIRRVNFMRYNNSVSQTIILFTGLNPSKKIQVTHNKIMVWPDDTSLCHEKQKCEVSTQSKITVKNYGLAMCTLTWLWPCPLWYDLEFSAWTQLGRREKLYKV